MLDMPTVASSLAAHLAQYNVLHDISVNWFIAQFVLCAFGYFLGRSVGRSLPAIADIAILLIVTFSVIWALRERALDTLATAAPLWALIYFESTLIVPPFMFMAGILAGRAGEPRAQRLGVLCAGFGMAYFIFNAAWMITPRVDDALSSRAVAAGPVTQSRDDTCVAAALATALGSSGVGLQVSESEMARAVDIRAGRGATLLRALKGLQYKLAGADLEPRLITTSADKLAAIASDDRPVLVTLRAGSTMTHMVVLYGRAGAGSVRIFNPSASDFAWGASDYMDFEDFRRRFTGNGIVLLPRGALPG